jgi:hypothetical protein
VRERKGHTLRKRRGFRLFGKFFGFEYSFIYTDGRPYLERWILYCCGTLRLHRFHDGDEPVFHDHPWWFITFPLRGYTEIVQWWDGQWREAARTVVPFWPHWRPAQYRHYVLKSAQPVWTIVITGDIENRWGFYPEPYEFVPYYEWSERIDS